MKKYFSLIAVAMIAVSSVFTSCSKDDEGSSFCPQVTTESSAAANTNNSLSSAAASSSSLAGTWTYSYDTNRSGYTAKDSTVYTFTADGKWTRTFIMDQSGIGVIAGMEHRVESQSGTFTFDASSNTLTLVQVDGIINAGSKATEATVTHTAHLDGNKLTIDNQEYTKK